MQWSHRRIGYGGGLVGRQSLNPSPLDASPLATSSAATANSSDPKVVVAGAEVPCAVQNAQDFDTYTKTVDGIVTKTYGADRPLTYQWSADKGTFKNGISSGQNVTWIAPDDITEPTSVIIRCTINDPSGPLVQAPDSGSRDDAPLVRACRVTVVPALTLSFEDNKTSIVAGGWDDSRHAYEYLEKETGVWNIRNQTPDPHITTLKATIAEDGQPLAGRSVTFKWDMPGAAPEETRTVLTDSKGEAKVKIISGDELSKSVDEESAQITYDHPVEVKVTCKTIEKSKALDVLAPTVEWQYKNEDGDYVAWDGKVWGLYPPRKGQERNTASRVAHL